MGEVRFFLIGSAEYPIDNHHIDWAEGAWHAIRDWYETQLGAKMKLGTPGLVVVHMNFPNGDHVNEEPGTAWGNVFDFTHRCSRIAGYDPWEYDGISELYFWRGGGGYAGGWSTETEPGGSLRHGWACVGDWWTEDGYDIEGRPGWVPAEAPKSYGGATHELGHAQLVGPHVFDPPSNFMGTGHLQFPNCTMTAEQAENIMRTGCYETVPPTPPTLPPEPEEHTCEQLRSVTNAFIDCADLAGDDKPLTPELDTFLRYLLRVPPASAEDPEGPPGP